MRNFLTLCITQLFFLSLTAQTFQGNQNSKDGTFQYPQRIKSSEPIFKAPSGTDEYCIPEGVDCSFGDGFSDFELADISNLSSGCSDQGYGDFTDMETDLTQGMTYTVNLASGYANQMICLWIDFNDNTEFEEDERLITDFEIVESGTFYTMDITVPVGVDNGLKRLRIRANWNESAQDPCDIWTYGETEDYSVNIGDPLDTDVGIVSIDMDEGYGPGDIVPIATVKNFGGVEQSFDVTMDIGSYSSTVAVSGLATGEEIEVEFDTWNAEMGTYATSVCTELEGDENPDNDCAQSGVIISGLDVGVVLVSTPGELMVGDHIPKVKVENFAYETQTFPVTITIGDYSDTQTVTNLAPMESVFVEFLVWSAEAGIYDAVACTELTDDENPDNDCASKQIFVGEGFPDFWAHETQVLTGLSLPFKDISSVQVTAWEWAFEGGEPATSTEPDPVITYVTPGIYDVSLTITGPNGDETITKSDYITVADEMTAEWTNVLSNGKWISDIHFIDESVGYFCGEDGMVYKTEDSGLTWEQNAANASGPWAYNIRFLDDLEGYISFYKAKLMKTEDGGDTWEWITPDVPTECRLFQLDVWDSEHIIIAGQKTGDTYLDAYSTQTGPGGFTAYQTPGGTQYNTLEYLSEDTLIMQHFMDITFSYDGGLTYTSYDNQVLFGYFKNEGYNTMSFGSNTVGFMGGSNYNIDGIGVISKTTDAGQTWTELREGFDECRGSHFIDEDIGFMVGHNGFIYKTIDGGENWYGTHLPTVDIEAVYIVNENLIFIASRGGDVYRSDNGFLQQPYLFDVSLKSVDLPGVVNLDNAPFDISTIVSNNGQTTIQDFILNYQINDGDIYSSPVTGLDPGLLNSVSMEETHQDAWMPASSGNYSVKVWVSDPNGEEDQFNSNDTLILDVTVTSELLHNRTVILEEATGTWCGWCPGGQLEVAYTLEQLNTEEIRVLAIALHGGDEFAFDKGDEIITAFGGGAYPAGWVDRYQFFGEPAVGLAGGTWTERSEERLEMDAPMNVEVEVYYNAASSTIGAYVSADVIAETAGNFRFNCYVLESGLIAPQSNYFNNVVGHPYYGMGDPIVDFEHNHVLRDIIGETWGTQGEFPNLVYPDENYIHEFNYTIPSEINLDEMQIIGFISNWDENLNYRSVINSNYVDFQDFIWVGVDSQRISEPAVSIFPNPFNSNFSLRLTNYEFGPLNIDLMDIMGNSVLHKEFNWNGEKVNIQTHDLSPGIYVLSVEINGKRELLKLVSE